MCGFAVGVTIGSVFGPRLLRSFVAAVVTCLSVAGCASRDTTESTPADAIGEGQTSARLSPWPTASGDVRRSSPSSVAGPVVGDLRWSRLLGGVVTPGPVVAADGSILAASNDGVLHALDPATGADRWMFDGGGRFGDDLSTSAALLADGSILWPGPHNTLFALSTSVNCCGVRRSMVWCCHRRLRSDLCTSLTGLATSPQSR